MATMRRIDVDGIKERLGKRVLDADLLHDVADLLEEIMNLNASIDACHENFARVCRERDAALGRVK